MIVTLGEAVIETLLHVGGVPALCAWSNFDCELALDAMQTAMATKRMILIISVHRVSKDRADISLIDSSRGRRDHYGNNVINNARVRRRA